MNLSNKLTVVLTAIVSIAGPMVTSATADDIVKVGKPGSSVAVMAFLDVGKEKGFFAEQGIELDITLFNGGGAQNQALTAGVVDVVVSSGGSMALGAKNAPFKAVGEIMGAPLAMSVITKPDSDIKTFEDLKGRNVGVTSATSITALLPREVAVSKGWGPKGINLVALGGAEALWAGVISGNIDAMVYGSEWGIPMQNKGEARIAMVFGDTIRDYITQVVLANNTFIAEKPDLLKRFLAGYFKTVAWVKEKPEEAAPLMGAAMEASTKDALAIILGQREAWYEDGRFREDDVKAIIAEYMDQELFTETPAKQQLYTEEFLPN